MITLRIEQVEPFGNIPNKLHEYIDNNKELGLSKKFVDGLFVNKELGDNVYDKLVTTFIILDDKVFPEFNDRIRLYLYDNDNGRNLTKVFDYGNNLKQIYLYHLLFNYDKNVATIKGFRADLNALNDSEEKMGKCLLDFDESQVEKAIKDLGISYHNPNRVRLKARSVQRLAEWYRAEYQRILGKDPKHVAWNDLNTSSDSIFNKIRTNYLTRKDVMDIVEDIDNVQISMVLLLLFKGVNKSAYAERNELGLLSAKNFDFDNQVIHIDGEHQRDIPINNDEIDYLKHLVQDTMGKDMRNNIVTLANEPYAFRQFYQGRQHSVGAIKNGVFSRRLRKITQDYGEKYNFEFNEKEIQNSGILHFMARWMMENSDNGRNTRDNINMAAIHCAFRFGKINREERDRMLVGDENRKLAKIRQTIGNFYKEYKTK